jgi:CRAL/TRIO domain
VAVVVVFVMVSHNLSQRQAAIAKFIERKASNMGFQLRRCRIEKVALRSLHRNVEEQSLVSRKQEVQVRAKSICNSTNLHERHLELQLSAPSYTSLSPIDNNPWSEKSLQEAIDLWELTDDQVDRLKELQIQLKDCAYHYKYDPHIILRFMTSPLAKDAEQLFRAMIKWRIDNNIDTMLDDYKPPRILLDYNPTAILKDYDREGDPIYVERGGVTDIYGFLKRFSREELMQYMIYTRELNTQGAWIKEYEKRQGRKVKDVTVVYDLKGLNSHHLNPRVMEFFKDIQTLNTEKYPGPIKRMIIIRAPAIFRVCWNIVKHFFPQSSRDKMIFAGKNYQKVLEKYMDLDVLPPCIWEDGKGEAATGLPPRMEGGMIPDHVQPKQPMLLESPSSKTYLTLESFEGTDQGSLTSGIGSDSSCASS